MEGGRYLSNCFISLLVNENDGSFFGIFIPNKWNPMNFVNFFLVILCSKHYWIIVFGFCKPKKWNFIKTHTHTFFIFLRF